MKMKLSFVCATVLAVAGAWAEEDTSAETPEQAAGQAEGLDKKLAAEDHRWFTTLPLCRRVHGSGEVLKPGETEWCPIEEGRFYPLGTSYRAGQKNGMVVISFGKTSSVTIKDGASFSTRPEKLGVMHRAVVLTGGMVSVNLPSNIKPGSFSVVTSSFSADNLCGESEFIYTDKGDGFVADIRCITGAIDISGRHYRIPAMHAADAVRIRSTHDDLETILYGKSGDYIAQLDRGQWYSLESQDDGTLKDVVQSTALDWHLSVDTRVQINRGVPAVGERMSVTMMTFDSAGTLKNHFAFSEKRPEVNTGELVARPSSEATDVAKRAAEVTTEAAATETVPAEEATSEETSTDVAP